MTKKSLDDLKAKVIQEPMLGIMSPSVKVQAEQAAFYSNKEGKFFRMDYCEEERFMCSDEDTREIFSFLYTDIDLSKEAFYKLVKID